jgi:hypothetical protein
MTPTQAEARRLIDEARDRGDTYYFTGVPCKRGHIAPRYVSTFNCAECRRTYGRKHDMKYKVSAKYKRAMRRYEQSEKGKVSQRRRDRSYRDTEKGRAVVRIQYATRTAAGSIPALAIIQIFGRAKKCYICGKRLPRRIRRPLTTSERSPTQVQTTLGILPRPTGHAIRRKARNEPIFCRVNFCKYAT